MSDNKVEAMKREYRKQSIKDDGIFDEWAYFADREAKRDAAIGEAIIALKKARHETPYSHSRCNCYKCECLKILQSVTEEK